MLIFNTNFYRKMLINYSPFDRVFLYTDLGIYFTYLLNFDHYINITNNRAFKVLGFMKHNIKQFSSATCIRTLYFALARSILKYGVII